VIFPSYLSWFVVAGCITTIAAVTLGLNEAVRRATWGRGERRLTVATAAALLVGWFALAVVLGSSGVYRGTSARLPTIEFGILIPILIGCVAIWRSSALSRLIDAIPRHWIIAVQAYRVEGVIFLLLYATNLLPGVFALPAGAGDMATGLMGLVIGINAARGRQLRPRTVLMWNLFGIADLIVALTMGFLTSPSPLQSFAFDHPNQLISVLPLVLIPTFLVPLAILLHIISLVQLGRATARVHTGLAHADDAVRA
jgi:hypothetical protein